MTLGRRRPHEPCNSASPCSGDATHALLRARARTPRLYAAGLQLFLAGRASNRCERLSASRRSERAPVRTQARGAPGPSGRPARRAVERAARERDSPSGQKQLPFVQTTLFMTWPVPAECRAWSMTVNVPFAGKVWVATVPGTTRVVPLRKIHVNP